MLSKISGQNKYIDLEMEYTLCTIHKNPINKINMSEFLTNSINNCSLEGSHDF